MATSDKYKRGSSGYSIADEKAAKRYAGYERTISEDALRRKQSGEKGYQPTLDRGEVESRVRNAENLYKAGQATEEGRKVYAGNMDFQRGEAAKIRETNSREQYMHEKEQGGPMTDLSYEEWKKL